MKICTKCKETKPITEYHRHPTSGRHSRCKPCRLEDQRIYKGRTRKERSLYEYKAGIKKRYGISYSDYQQLLVHHNNSCAICNTPQEDLNRRLDVDHCHSSGKIRGLLCSNCNNGIGHFKDDSTLLLRAIDYLRKTS